MRKRTAQVSYPLDKFPDMDNKLREVAERCHGWVGSNSGAGFGFRDIEFDFRSEWSKQKFITLVEKLYPDVVV